MKIKNLEIKKALRNTAIAFLTGAFLTTTPVGSLATKVEASSISTVASSNAMNYFRNSLNDDVQKYLNKSISSTNFSRLLGCYDTLYDYIFRGKEVNNTFYNNLSTYEQSELNYLLNSWGNSIYETYKSQSYFNNTSKNALGFVLTYNSMEIGYDKDHQKTMDWYTKTLDEQLDDNLYETNSKYYLSKCLDVYNKLVNFIKGSTKNNGYYFNELTITEQQDIVRLLENWTYSIINEYSDYSYYSSTCVEKINWTVSIENLYRELGEYISNYSSITNPQYIGSNTTYVPPVVDTNIQIYPPNLNVNQNLTPSISIPTTPSVPTVNAESQPINGTVGKDWHQSYYDPSINTSNGVYDYVPETTDGLNNNIYNQYSNNYYGYPNYNGYNNGSYNIYDQGYVEDYVPTYVPR